VVILRSRAFATIQGVSRTITTVGTFMGPILAGFLYDLTHSYTIAFAIFSIVSLLSLLLMFFAKPPVKENEETLVSP